VVLQVGDPGKTGNLTHTPVATRTNSISTSSPSTLFRKRTCSSMVHSITKSVKDKLTNSKHSRHIWNELYELVHRNIFSKARPTFHREGNIQESILRMSQLSDRGPEMKSSR
jgi:hypothetical protein